MLIKEYRIVMPLTVHEYHIGQQYSTIKASKNESGGGDGIEIVENKKFQNVPLLNGKFSTGQYTYKIYHLESKAPTLLRLILPKGALKLYEESWNAFPYCKTVLTNPGYMKENFILIIESLHLEGDTNEENALELPAEQLKEREVVIIDIAAPVEVQDYKESEDPSRIKSSKTGRGPLGSNWRSKTPLMTCYKVVFIDCKWFGLQRRIEKLIQACELRLFTVFHRQIFCWIDEWYGLTPKQINEIEEKAKHELDECRTTGTVRGLQGGNTEPD